MAVTFDDFPTTPSSGPSLTLGTILNNKLNALKTAVNGLLTAIDSKSDKSASLLAWAYGQSFRLVSGTRDANGALTSGSVLWPDGATGTFTADTLSTAFPGAIDAYHVTHVLSGVTITFTQPAVTRDAATGAVIAQPALVLS